MNIERILGPDGLLSKHMPGYEYRPQQIEAASAIHKALTSKRHCIAEAGTGVGKSMAYLLPIIDYVKNRKRVVVSTHTIYLQSQLMSKDIPFLREILPQNEFKVALVKGRGNYLCLNNFDVDFGQLSLINEGNTDRIQKWAAETKTGDIGELDFQFSGWSDICSDQDTCHRQDCHLYSKCFYYNMRNIAAEADIIITNHSLFFSDLAVRMENPKAGILPDYDAVVFDEAHHLEDVATKVFGIEYNSFLVPSLLNRVKRTKDIGIDPTRIQNIEDINTELLDVFTSSPKQEFFLKDMYNQGGKDRIESAASSLCTLIDGLSRELIDQDTEGKPELKERIDGYRRKCSRLKDDINSIFFGPTEGNFKWGERVKSGRYTNCFIRQSPLNVADILPDNLWKTVSSAILTSATIANSGGFSYIKARLGLEECDEILEDSPFNFAKQCLLYIPRHFEPPDESNVYADKVAREIEEIVRASHGRAFLLFTSYRMLNAVYDRLIGKLPYVMLKQGDFANEELVREFLKQDNACLFGVHSFWEGIDIKGEALSCVVIDKLPFAAPDSPMVKARADAVNASGGNGFTDYAIPQAQTRLKQGFGRLIRTSKDRGVVAILDSRLVKKAYGREFLKFLPRCPITIKMDDVKDFFEGKEVPGVKTPW
ncbi:MAG: ATP-dependent DNA helicase [Armatimonadota bacterium]